MKKLILIFALITFLQGYSQKDFHRKEVLSIEGISISYFNQRLEIDVKNKKPVHFQIWKNNEMILNAEGSAAGEEFFPIMKGKYKFIIFDGPSKSITKYFRI